MRRALTTFELRRNKIAREEFLTLPRRPITVVLDGVTQNYNIGALFRLCDAFLVQQLVICGTQVDLRKRRLVQAAQGTQHWVPWSERQHAAEAMADAKVRGDWLVAAEQTTASVRPDQLTAKVPACLVLGGERSGVSPDVLEWQTPPSQSQCSAWRIRSTSRPPHPSCFTGFHCTLKELNSKARLLAFCSLYCPNNLACLWRSSRLSNLPLGFLGKASANTISFGTLNAAKCSAQWACMASFDSDCPALTTMTATTASTQSGCGTPTTATSDTCGNR